MYSQVAVQRTLIDAVLPDRRVLHNVMLVAGFTLVIAASARIAVPLPFTPVPITMQTLTVLLAGVLLGTRLGAVTIVAYLTEGAAGLPVFAPTTAPGPAALIGPTGGYLIGFVFAAAAVGALAEHGWDRRHATTLLAMILGNLVIYAFGVGWLSRFLGLTGAVANGLLPFLVGDAIKIGLAMAALPVGWQFLQRNQNVSQE
jgi:biotin transport system substrate-specific component